MNQKNILIATTNEAKCDEFMRYLNLPNCNFKTLKDFPNLPEEIENKSTFKENAIEKSIHYATLSKLPTLASDGGLCIDALGGAPGVLSRRWPGYSASDEELNKIALTKLKNVPDEHRTAKLKITICFALPSGKFITSTAYIPGKIAAKIGPYPKGFPYRGLFLVKPCKKYYSELTNKEHESVNHWRKALEDLRPKILKLL